MTIALSYGMQHGGQTALLLDLIHEIGDSVTSAADSAKIVRLTDQKEIHAASVKHDITTIWGDYFKDPQIEAFPEVHELVHTIMQQASKCKQSIARENGDHLLTSVNRFAEIFWATKGFETHMVVAPYPPALGVIQPILTSAQFISRLWQQYAAEFGVR